tara:strand:- start:195 stop:854 length:660 start_codon:yes stop_codon:yes gene_type:complete
MGDYMRDTSHLSLVEHGVYNVLLDIYYSTGKPLPEDLPSLCRMCRAQKQSEIGAVSRVVSLYFPVGEGNKRYNERAEREISKNRQKALVNKEIGKLGGRPTKTETVSDSVSDSVSKRFPNENLSQIPDTRKNNNRAFALPDWVPADTWKDYEEMRNRIRKPMTDRAKQLAIIDLAKMQARGFDPKESLENSIKNSWQGLFEPRKGNGQASGQASRQVAL